MLLAGGGWFKTFAWHALPFTGYVRLNGEFTYFSILILFLLAAAGLDSYLKKKNANPGIENIFRVLKILFITSTLAAVLILFITKSSFLFTEKTGSGKSFIKSIADKTSFADLLFIQSLILLLTVWLIEKFRYRKQASFIFICLNLVITTWLCLPFTGLGMKSKAAIQSVLNKTPKGIQLQQLTTVEQTRLIQPEKERELIMHSSYSKKIGHPEMEDYPVQLQSSAAFFADSALKRFIDKQAWMFLSTDTTVNAATDFSDSSIQVSENGPGKIKCTINNRGFKWLILLQNNFPYWSILIDGVIVKHLTAFKTFIAVPIEAGKHSVEFNFNPRPVKTALGINVFVFLLMLLLLSVKQICEKRIFK